MVCCRCVCLGSSITIPPSTVHLLFNYDDPFSSLVFGTGWLFQMIPHMKMDNAKNEEWKCWMLSGTWDVVASQWLRYGENINAWRMTRNARTKEVTGGNSKEWCKGLWKCEVWKILNTTDSKVSARVVTADALSAGADELELRPCRAWSLIAKGKRKRKRQRKEKSEGKVRIPGERVSMPGTTTGNWTPGRILTYKS